MKLLFYFAVAGIAIVAISDLISKERTVREHTKQLHQHSPATGWSANDVLTSFGQPLLTRMVGPGHERWIYPGKMVDFQNGRVSDFCNIVIHPSRPRTAPAQRQTYSFVAGLGYVEHAAWFTGMEQFAGSGPGNNLRTSNDVTRQWGWDRSGTRLDQPSRRAE